MSSVMEEEVIIAEDELASLPKGWRWKTMEEVSEVVNGATPKTGNPANYEDGTIAWLTPADLSGYTEKFIDQGARFITKKGLESCSTHLLPKGTVLFTSRAPIGYVAIASGEVCTNQGFKSYVPDTRQVTSDYLYWWLKGAKQMAEAVASGTTFLELSTVKARKLPVPVAPLPEQRRIVEAIELQLGRLDAAVARLHAAKAKLKRYRQAVLKAAVEGPLLKGDYSWVTIEEASERIVDCLHSTPKFTEYGKYCIDTTCIEQGKIRFDKARFVSEESFTERIRRLKPEAGDILFAREGTVGTTVVVPEDVDLCLGQRMMMFRLKKFVVPKFFMYVMQSAIIVDKYRPLIMGTTAPHLNIRDIRKFTLPEYPMPLQQQIVARLDEIFEVLREQEFTLDTQLAHSTRLRQSVLKRAFEGRLV